MKQRTVETAEERDTLVGLRSRNNFELNLVHSRYGCGPGSGAEVFSTLTLIQQSHILGIQTDQTKMQLTLSSVALEKYPSVVSLPGGCRSEVMILNHPELSGCVLFVHWSVDVSREGGVSPKMELLTKIPERALQLFPSQPVGGAAEAFQSLLRILGPEAAIESVIMAVSLSQDT
ncbi:hypothetical protein VZT92_013658 [Zoarces viviparus]|uniref:Centromere protein P n=2 Tax=Zoarces viviparus TaxID=48416 RepID=A0AAW1F5R4_ZOAVI